MELQSEILYFALFIPHMLFALSVHEASHAYSAYLLGDDTAALLGRVTLNPLKHLDPIGVAAFIIIKLGWAKPVPVNPLRFKNPRRDNLLVSAAGPGSNLAMGAVLMSLIFFIHYTFKTGPSELRDGVLAFLFVGAQLNVALCFFNLIPVPPLDGSHVLLGILPEKMADAIEPFFNQGFLLLLGLIIVSRFLHIPVFDYLIWKPMAFIMHGFLGEEAWANAITAFQAFITP